MATTGGVDGLNSLFGDAVFIPALVGVVETVELLDLGDLDDEGGVVKPAGVRAWAGTSSCGA